MAGSDVEMKGRALLLDSSVVLKWFRRSEVLCEEAVWVRQAYLKGQIRLHLTDLLFYEVANVLRCKPDLNTMIVQKAMESLFEMRLPIERLSADRLARSIEVAFKYQVTLYDATFVAIAESANLDLLTADLKLARRLGKLPHIMYLGNFSA
jgi:predicted nucleic acid-binding protein